jgi:hypothetical protein
MQAAASTLLLLRSRFASQQSGVRQGGAHGSNAELGALWLGSCGALQGWHTTSWLQAPLPQPNAPLPVLPLPASAPLVRPPSWWKPLATGVQAACGDELPARTSSVAGSAADALRCGCVRPGRGTQCQHYWPQAMSAWPGRQSHTAT